MLWYICFLPVWSVADSVIWLLLYPNHTSWIGFQAAKKLATSNSVFQANSRDGFFRKSPFCTFSCINPGFGGPWDMLQIFFLIVIFIILQKNAFGQKCFKFHARIQNTILAIFNFFQNSTFECIKFEFIFCQKHSFEAI